MCNSYTDLKYDYIYRGDIFEDVPFISLDGKAIPIGSDPPELLDPWTLDAPPPPKTSRRQTQAFVGSLERLRGVVLHRTCEANRFGGIRKIYPCIHVAPVRPIAHFNMKPDDERAYMEKVLYGTTDEATGKTTHTWRFMLLPACGHHSMPTPSLVCLREMQPVHAFYLLKCAKVARLSRESVGALVHRTKMFLEQTERDDEEDAGAEWSGEPSELLETWNKRANPPPFQRSPDDAAVGGAADPVSADE